MTRPALPAPVRLLLRRAAGFAAWLYWLAVNFLRWALGGPSCPCGEVAWSDAWALRKGWRWATWYGGYPQWICQHCLVNDVEAERSAARWL